MTLAAPHVYIGDVLMDSHALSDIPVLAGLSFDWGTDSMIDFDDSKTLSAELLIREPSTLDFLTVGAPFGLIDPETGTTFFAGRIATLRAKPDSRRSDALLISLTAADTTADLQQYRVQRIDWWRPGTNLPATLAAERHNQLRSAMPAGWTLDGGTQRDTWTTAAPQRGTATELLPYIDRHCRSVIGRRHNTSRYIPGTGLAPRLTITEERSKVATADRLTTDAAGKWQMSTTAPSNSAVVKLAGNQVAAAIEWEKNPDDVITDVALTLHSVNYEVDNNGTVTPTEDNGTFDLWVGVYLGVDNTAIQQKYGFHQLQLDIDSAGGSSQTNPHIGQIVNYWIEADAQWRPTAVSIPDSRRLPDNTVRALLGTSSRINAYTTIDGLPANNPAGGSRVRGYAIGGSATWTGKKWVIELTLGRVPRPATGAGVLTFNSIRAHSNPAISAGTAATVGEALSFADFEYIGA